MTAPRTWDVTLRIVDGHGNDGPEDWFWVPEEMDSAWWKGMTLEFLSAMEVKTWRFGDIVTDDNKPDVPFNIVDSKAVVVDERYDLSKDRGVWRLIRLDGQDLTEGDK